MADHTILILVILGLSTYGFIVDDIFVVKSPLQIQKVVNE